MDAQLVNGIYQKNDPSGVVPTHSHISRARTGSYTRSVQPIYPVKILVVGGVVGSIDRGMNFSSNLYGCPTAAPSYQPTPMYSRKGLIAKNQALVRIIHIAALNPYQG